MNNQSFIDEIECDEALLVVDEEEFEITKEEKQSLKKLALAAILSIQIMLIGGLLYEKTNNKNHNIETNIYYEDIEAVNKSLAKEKRQLGNNYIGELSDSDGYLIYSKPISTTKDGQTIYTAPVGYAFDQGICYKKVITKEGAEKESIYKEIPAGYIMVGNFAYDVITPYEVLNSDGKIEYVAPEGYTLEGNLCYKKINLQEFEDTKQAKLTLK